MKKKNFHSKQRLGNFGKKKLLSAGFLSAATTLCASNLVLADNTTFPGQNTYNSSPLGSLLGGVGGVVNNTLGIGQNSVRSVVNTGTGAIGGALSPIGGMVSPVGNAISPVGNMISPGTGSVSQMGGATSPVSGAVNGTFNSFTNLTQQNLFSPNQVNNTHGIAGSINHVAVPGQGNQNMILPIFNHADLKTVRGLSVVELPLIGSALQTSPAKELVYASQQTSVHEVGAGRLLLSSGNMLLTLPGAKNSVLVETPIGKVWVGKTADVLVGYSDGILKVYNLDSIGQNVRLVLNGSPEKTQTVVIRPGYELLASNRTLNLEALRPADGVARRNQILLNNNKMAVSEVNLTSLIKNQPLLSSLQRSASTAERRIFDRVVKTAAILDVTRGRGGFVATALAPASSVAREVTGVVLSTAGEATGAVLGSLLPGLGGGNGGGNNGGGGGNGGGNGGGVGVPPVVVSVPPLTPGQATPAPSTANAQNTPTPSSSTQTQRDAVGSLNGLLASRTPPTQYHEVSKRTTPAATIRTLRREENLDKAAKSATTERTTRKTDANGKLLPMGPAQADQVAQTIYGPEAPSTPTTFTNASDQNASTKTGDTANSAHLVTKNNNAFDPGEHSKKILSTAKDSIRKFPEFFLALVVLIISLLVVSLMLARSAFFRARELEAVNKRLASEINDRKMIEQRANQLNEDLELRLEELAQLNQALETARDQAVEGSRLKSEFVANISHEIRTPISAVIGMNQLMLNTKLDAKQKDYARLVKESAQGLLTIINDILDFSKIEAGKLEVASVSFSLDSVMKEVAELLASSVQEKELKLFTFVDHSVNKTFRGDPARLRQVLVNLAGNAVKFTSSGEVIIHVSLAPAADEGSGRVRFTVRDSGIGIPENAQAKLFQPFVQADGSTTRRYGGTGLGLSISKRLVELMGGTIQVESKEGEGSTFWFDLPSWANTAEKKISSENPSSFTDKKFLVISSLPYSPQILSAHMSAIGMKSDLLNSPTIEIDELKERLKTSTYSAIVVDSLLAADVAKVFRSMPKLTKDLPVIYVRESETAKPPASLHASCITTPLSETDLVQWISSAARGETDKLQEKEIQSNDANQLPDVPFVNTSILVAEDSLVLQRMVKQLLEKLGCNVEIVSNGKEAVEAATNNKYNMIFMDWQMPEMDGLEATRNIREIESASGHHIPIIAMTANAMHGDKDTCLSAGMDGYMSKPFRMDDLRAIIKQFGDKENKSESKQDDASSPGSAGSLPAFEKSEKH